MASQDQYLKICEEGEIPVLVFSTYFDGETLGPETVKAVERLLQQGKTCLIMDFSGCPVINSSALGTLLNLGGRISDDFQGRLVLVGLTELQHRVLGLAGVTLFAKEAPTIEEALEVLRA